MGCILRHWFTESYDISAVYEHVIAIRTGLLFLTHDKIFSGLARHSVAFGIRGKEPTCWCLEHTPSPSSRATAVINDYRSDFHLSMRIHVAELCLITGLLPPLEDSHATVRTHEIQQFSFFRNESNGITSGRHSQDSAHVLCCSRVEQPQGDQHSRLMSKR